MLTFTLAISCLTTFNLPWFMDLTFQVPMQYCSLQHRILLLSPVTSTAGYCFCFGFHPFILSEVSPLLITSSILGTYRPGELLFQYPIILTFHIFHAVLKARILKWFAFPSPVDHILSDLSTMTRLSCLYLGKAKPCLADRAVQGFPGGPGVKDCLPVQRTWVRSLLL